MGDEKIVPWGGVTRLDLSPERVLTKAVELDLEGVVIAGWTKDGQEYFATTYADGGDVLWLIEKFKKALLEYDQ